MNTIGQLSSPSPDGSILKKIYIELSEAPFYFRERICFECNWSYPTFYRTLRKQPTFSKVGQILPEVSNANKDKIISVLGEILKVLEDLYNRYNEG